MRWVKKFVLNWFEKCSRLRDLEALLQDKVNLREQRAIKRGIKADHFLHHAQVITIKGRSYRLKDRTPKDFQAN